MKELIKKIPILRSVARRMWQLLHIGEVLAQYHETNRQLLLAQQSADLLKADLQALRQEITSMKQDLTVLRQENAELRGLGIVVPRIEAQDEAIALLRKALEDHRDGAHQLHERIRRDLLTLSRKLEP